MNVNQPRNFLTNKNSPEPCCAVLLVKQDLFQL